MHEISRFLKDTEGAAAIEYGLITALIVVVCIASLTSLGDRVQQVMTCSIVSFIPEYQVSNNVNC